MANIYWLDVNTDWANTANWSSGTVPATGDTVYILSGAQGIATNLNQSAVTLANLIIGMGFAGTIGSATAPLQIGATNWTIGQPTTGTSRGNGSGRIWIDFGTAAFVGNVLNTSNSSTDANLAPVRIKGVNASNVLSVLAGTVDVATTHPTDTATIPTANVAGGTLNYGFGVTWTSVDVANGAHFTAQTAGTTLTVAPGGEATIYGTGNLTTVNNGGTANLDNRPAAGSIVGTLNTYEGGTTDFSGNPVAGTVGTHNLYAGGTAKTSPAVPNHITTTTRNLINGGTLQLS